jgi:hypothetical protein
MARLDMPGRRRTYLASARGFSFVETIVAAGIVVALGAVMVELARGARVGAAAISDTADVHQRLRVAADAIERDLLVAGAGPFGSEGGGPLASYVPPIRPAAARSGDTDITFAADHISILWVPQTRAEAEITGPTAAGGLPIGNVPACVTLPACGFEAGMQALVADTRGPGFGYDVFTVGSTSAGWISKTADEGSFSGTYGTTAYVTEVVQHTYYLDRSNPANIRLMRGGGRTVLPLVDGVEDLHFTYFADPDPMSVSQAGASAGTCVYQAGSPRRPLLAALGGQSLARLAAADLTDGPFCGTPPNRFDADLLRIRRVRVDMRVGGPSGGSRPSSFELSFDVAPRNLNASR